MTNFEITFEAVLCNEDCTEDEISATFDALMEALVDLGVEGPFVGGSLATRQVEISMVVEAPTQDKAFAKGGQLIAEALEKAGLELVTSPGDSTGLAWSSTSVRPAV